MPIPRVIVQRLAVRLVNHHQTALMTLMGTTQALARLSRRALKLVRVPCLPCVVRLVTSFVCRRGMAWARPLLRVSVVVAACPHRR